jgi:hypothetical protein
VDDLEASIVDTIRAHDGAFEDEDQLREWLATAGVEFDDRQFSLGLGHLWRIGRLRQPRDVEWTVKGAARPTWLVEPRVDRG